MSATLPQLAYFVFFVGWGAFATVTLASIAPTQRQRLLWFVSGLFAVTPAAALLSDIFRILPT